MGKKSNTNEHSGKGQKFIEGLIAVWEWKCLKQSKVQTVQSGCSAGHISGCKAKKVKMPTCPRCVKHHPMM